MILHAPVPKFTQAVLTALVVGVLGTHTSCGKVSEPGDAMRDVQVERSSRVVAEKVSLQGEVKLTGGRPLNAGTTVDVGGNPFCSAHGAIVDPTWTVSEDGGLGNVVVTVLGADRASNVLKEPVLINQKNCVFEPYVTVVQAGQNARIHNDDATFHNVRIALHEVGTRSGGENLDNFGQPSKGFESIKAFEQAGVYRLECDVHRWMKCWVVAHDTAHVAVTAADGSFSIPRELADGEYTVEAWHPQFPEKVSKPVRISGGQGIVTFSFDLANAFDP